MESIRTTGCVNCHKTKIEGIDAFSYKCVGNCSNTLDADSLTEGNVKNSCSDRGGCCGGPVDDSGCSCKS